MNDRYPRDREYHFGHLYMSSRQLKAKMERQWQAQRVADPVRPACWMVAANHLVHYRYRPVADEDDR